MSTLQTFVGKKVEPCTFKLKFCLILGYPIQSEWDAKKIVVHTSMKAHLQCTINLCRKNVYQTFLNQSQICLFFM